jgi:adenosine deaminase
MSPARAGLRTSAQKQWLPLGWGRGVPKPGKVTPKIHLHCHLEGTLRPRTFVELAAREGVAVPQPPYAFADFAGFLRVFMDVCRVLGRPDDYARLAREFASDAVAEGVIYGELFVSPSAWSYFHPDLDVRASLRAIAAELRDVEGASFALILDVTRNLGAESAMRTVDLALSCSDCGIVGIGLGGDEVRFPAELFVDVFAYARAHGLHTVAHAGEAAGAQSVRATVEVLGAERIGHGVRAIEDAEVVRLLVERRVPLEICPTSNFLTGAVSRKKPHPLLALHAAGVPVTIDADDPAIFGTSIENEYRYVAQLAGHDALHTMVGNAIEASFASMQLKEAMRAQLNLAGKVIV